MSRARTLAGAIGSDGALNVADVAGLAAVASSGSAADLSTGTLPNARLATGAAAANLGYTPANKAGDNFTGDVSIGSGDASGAVTTPRKLSLGGSYASAAGTKAKLALYENGANFLGLGISENQLDYIVNNSAYDHVFYGASAAEIIRIKNGGGIKFPDTQRASTNGKTLDDYEEGTWSPFDSATVTARSISIPCQAHYVKIGRMCHIWMRIQIGNTANSSQITGTLPFAGSNPTLNTGTSPFFIPTFPNTGVAGSPGFCYNPGSGNSFGLYTNNSNYAAWAWNSGATEITIIGSYRTEN